ncbi:MAG: hypothetical protein H7A46_02975 [Verrucomicrobiales bacterium]|nr:hypothetical protein [Verrucomicrobiales bacterium]
MSEIAEFVKHGAARVTPATLEETVRKVPMWKAGFTQIEADQFPHIGAQLDFLANVVEDFHGGALKDLPYTALAAAVFALKYAADEFDLIPDRTQGVGRADDSSVVRAALIMHERAFARCASNMGHDWNAITTKA